MPKKDNLPRRADAQDRMPHHQTLFGNPSPYRKLLLMYSWPALRR